MATDRPRVSGETSQTILDAACLIASRDGLTAVTAGRVATAVGRSKSTVDKAFGSMAGLHAAMINKALLYLTELGRHVDFASPQDGLAACWDCFSSVPGVATLVTQLTSCASADRGAGAGLPKAFGERWKAARETLIGDATRKRTAGRAECEMAVDRFMSAFVLTAFRLAMDPALSEAGLARTMP